MNSSLSEPQTTPRDVSHARKQMLPNFLTDFFLQVGTPLNLAVFRIALFATMLTLANPQQVIRYSAMPHELLRAPYGLSGVLAVLPIDPATGQISFFLYVTLCVLGLIGFGTRITVPAAAIVALYVLGVPQCFGKVNHTTHELIWFSLILSTSRCADMLSVDAALKAWKTGRKHIIEPPKPSRAYALPLRFNWLSLAVIYLCPGLWKLHTSGLAWAFGDSLKMQLYFKWLSYQDGFIPWRIDRVPYLLQAAAFGTLLFELGFIVAIFSCIGRTILLVAGPMFHTGTLVFMRINFNAIVGCYSSLFDWSWGFSRISKRLFPEILSVSIDGPPGNAKDRARQITSVIRTFDIFGAIVYKKNEDADTETSPDRLGRVQGPKANTVDCFRANLNGQTYEGTDALLAMAKRVPALWLALPAIKTAWFQNLISKTSASATTNTETSKDSPLPNSGTNKGLIATVVVGVSVITTNMAFGAAGITDAWPFACYPRFDETPPNLLCDIVSIEVFDKNGQELHVPSLASAHWANAWRKTLHMSDEHARQNRLMTLWNHNFQKNPELVAATVVRIYREGVTADPDQRAQNPLSRDLMLEFRNLPAGR